jgi:hypothetical protein
MHGAGLASVSRRKRCTTHREREARPAPDLVARLHRRCPQSAVGGGYHLRPNVGRLFVSGGGAGCLESACSRMGDGHSSACRAGVESVTYTAPTACVITRDGAVGYGDLWSIVATRTNAAVKS